LDDPERQYQGPWKVELAKEGHLVVYGAPDTGKTTLLQTLITSLAMEHTPEEVNLYLVDFGGGLLTPFAPLPSVGDVILPGESEKADGLLHFLLKELDVRRQLFAQADVNTLAAYRNRTGQPMPAIVLVVDDYDAFARIYSEMVDQLTALFQAGGSFGIHVVLSAAAASSVGSSIRDNANVTVAFQLMDPTEYGPSVGYTGLLRPLPVPGRGLVRGTPPLEFQAALPVAGSAGTESSAALKALVKQISRAWPESKPRARPILVSSTNQVEHGNPSA
jgi:S-DNA-T family DNA segregation ATPase FtsK/SpoIIIE